MKTRQELLNEKILVERRIHDLKDLVAGAELRQLTTGEAIDPVWLARMEKKIRGETFLVHRINTELAATKVQRQEDAELFYQNKYIRLLKRLRAYQDTLSPEQAWALEAALKKEVSDER